MSELKYKCITCGKVEIGDPAKLMKCCNQEMISFREDENICTSAKDAEQYRSVDDDDSCDDGRADK